MKGATERWHRRWLPRVEPPVGGNIADLPEPCGMASGTNGEEFFLCHILQGAACAVLHATRRESTGDSAGTLVAFPRGLGIRSKLDGAEGTGDHVKTALLAF